MVSDSYLVVDLNDPRTNALADVISNKTCKKLLGLLAEQELSESELARELKVPSNTVNYNIKKLMKAGLIKEVRSLWSSKGKAVKVYRVSQKKIVISPKTMVRGLLPALIVSAFLSFFLWVQSYRQMSLFAQKSLDVSSEALRGASSLTAAGAVPEAVTSAEPLIWIWFLAGAVVALAALVFWNKFISQRTV